MISFVLKNSNKIDELRVPLFFQSIYRTSRPKDNTMGIEYESDLGKTLQILPLQKLKSMSGKLFSLLAE